jgi:hypothetical protein
MDSLRNWPSPYLVHIGSLGRRSEDSINQGMKVKISSEINRFGKVFGFIFCVMSVFGLSGCAGTLVRYPADANMIDSHGPYPIVDADKVVYFPTKEDLPTDLHMIAIAELVSPANSNWTFGDLVMEFQKKAGELGANAIVLERVDTENNGSERPAYKGKAMAYRFYKETPSEFYDMKSSYKSTQMPDPPIPKGTVIYSYPGISSQ